MTPKTVRVTLRGMRFHVRVGVLPHERELAQPLEIDVEADVASGLVLDYRSLYDEVAAVTAAQPLEYLESIAEAIASRALALPGVARTVVRVRKPHVALGGPLDHAEIAIERER